MQSLEELNLELDLSLSPDQISKLVQHHKKVHVPLERRERDDTIIRMAKRNRRGPFRDQVRDRIRQAVKAGTPAYWVSYLREWEAKLGE
jgi:hypothetical protein